MRGIYRRGVKYPEKIMDHSKGATTIACGSADGVLLPTYVIYFHLYNTWREGGPYGYPCCNKPCWSHGKIYNRTTSGWLDVVNFRDCFINRFLRHERRLLGPKALFGGNLSKSLDNDVLRMCAEHNTSFISLVPNSTRICQPLVVGLPLKQAWRTTHTE